MIGDISVNIFQIVDLLIIYIDFMPLPIEGQQLTLSHKNQVGRPVRSDADSSPGSGGALTLLDRGPGVAEGARGYKVLPSAGRYIKRHLKTVL